MDEIPQKGTTWMEPMNLVLLLVKDNPNSVEKAPSSGTTIFFETRYKRRCLKKRAYTHPYERTHTPYFYEHLRETVSKKLDPAGFEIDEVTTCISQSTGKPPPTKTYYTLICI
jgi:hypothetical protein